MTNSWLWPNISCIHNTSGKIVQTIRKQVVPIVIRRVNSSRIPKSIQAAIVIRNSIEQRLSWVVSYQWHFCADQAVYINSIYSLQV